MYLFDTEVHFLLAALQRGFTAAALSRPAFESDANKQEPCSERRRQRQRLAHVQLPHVNQKSLRTTHSMYLLDVGLVKINLHNLNKQEKAVKESPDILNAH